jgi:ribosomal protein L37AE/L43A
MKCEACGATAVKIESIGDVDVYQCQECDHVFNVQADVFEVFSKPTERFILKHIVGGLYA